MTTKLTAIARENDKFTLRLEGSVEKDYSYKLPVQTTRGMNGKMNLSTECKVTVATKTISHVFEVEISEAEAKEIVDELKQLDAVTIERHDKFHWVVRLK